VRTKYQAKHIYEEADVSFGVSASSTTSELALDRAAYGPDAWRVDPRQRADNEWTQREPRQPFGTEWIVEASIGARHGSDR
jgi:hypothetical protein